MFSGFGFGGEKKKPETLGEVALQKNKEEVDDGASKSSKGVSSVHGFDPSALERAAKAAKELDKSKNSKQALETIIAAEVTAQKKHEAERAQFQTMQQELAIRRVKEEEEASARTLQRQSQHDKERADYRDTLERKRMAQQLEAQKQMQEEERKKAEESLRRQEEIRRKTLEYESELRQQTEMARVKAETEGRIKQERVNHDLTMETKMLELSQARDTLLQAITVAGTTVGNGIKEFITDREKLINVTATVTAIGFGLYSAKVVARVGGQFIESRLGKPSLVRETTKKNVLQMIKSPITSFKLAFGTSNQGNVALQNVILEKTLEDRLSRIAKSTANTKKNNAPFRHLLLHGPPGTGKTMFAKGLARESGLHYAIMTGGDVAPLGKDAVSEMHKLFDWAQTTNKGVVLFVDEADAFLRKRSTEKISEDMRNALNAFLYRTGEASKKFMIVYASNQPEQFDWAINDRIDELVEFKLPGYDERLRMIVQYMDQYLFHPPAGSKEVSVVDVDEEAIKFIAEETEGYSGREISKLAIAWQAAAYGTENAVLSRELLMQVLSESKIGKVQKQTWLNREQIHHFSTDSKVEGFKHP
jgi:ATPase family AAA domain-containing protein 3A/B